jgi:hypothetical protein
MTVSPKVPPAASSCAHFASSWLNKADATVMIPPAT